MRKNSLISLSDLVTILFFILIKSNIWPVHCNLPRSAAEWTLPAATRITFSPSSAAISFGLWKFALLSPNPNCPYGEIKKKGIGIVQRGYRIEDFVFLLRCSIPTSTRRHRWKLLLEHAQYQQQHSWPLNEPFRKNEICNTSERGQLLVFQKEKN